MQLTIINAYILKKLKHHIKLTFNKIDSNRT